LEATEVRTAHRKRLEEESRKKWNGILENVRKVGVEKES